MFKKLFVWWDQETLGTMIYTFIFGKLKGIDELGNKYYESKSKKRWVIYKNEIDSSKISNDWYLWIHFMTNIHPGKEKNNNYYFWQKKRLSNLTGTDKAYRPNKILDNKNIKKKYESWKS